MTPLPPGFRLVVDRRTRRLHGDRLLVGGHPQRVLRVSDRGAGIVHALFDGRPVTGRVDGLLARRLVNAGLAHPVPARSTSSMAVVIPVYDDADALERCLGGLGDALPVRVVDDGSSDHERIRAICTRHVATLQRMPRNGGPAAARNAGAHDVATDLIAFVDSDALTTTAALRQLAAHFADPDVAAAAPRVRPSPCSAADALALFADAQSPLDLGDNTSLVGPQQLVSYVPSTVLVVRRTAFEAVGGFDPSLRFGEDVDLVWRLSAAGFGVRYAAQVRVGHHEPTSWRQWLARRYDYGTSAAALARRHPSAAVTLRLRPAPSAAVALAAAGRTRLGLAAATVTTVRLASRLHRHDVPMTPVATAAIAAPATSALALARWALPLWWPVMVAAALRSQSLRSGRLRRAALAGLVAPPMMSWLARRPAMDPLRWTVASWADAAAYGAGVWRGCWRERTAAPLLPRIALDAPPSPKRHATET